MKRSRRLLDETGQMSIFVALVFQVLFVFFAMVVNIGLIVHDKINLQNSVDFGAFYAAQRQSEILNEIAHINYQIRQDYKLLAWRYRVLGTLGRQLYGDDNNQQGLPPARTNSGFPLPDEEFTLLQNELPAVCVMNRAWGDVTVQSASRENYCFRPYGEPTQLTPITPIVAPWVPGVFAQRSSENFSRSTQLNNCSLGGPMNWLFTMQMIYGYKLSIATRKQEIFRLRRLLVDPNFRDSQEQPVREGVRQTVRRNLTSTNAESFDDGYFAMYNGLSHPDCIGPNGNGDVTIVDIPTKPTLVFTNVDTSTNCVSFQDTHDNTNGANAARFAQLDPTNSMRLLAQEPSVQGEQYPEHSSLGFEKNPWCMAYVGVRARTRPRKPFAPFGEPVSLEARSFAQPFGGRIGPWYNNSWSKTSNFSDGGTRVDPLTSPRMIGNNVVGTVYERLPNFSRYPGDQLGLRSKVALGAQRHILRNFYGTSGPSATRLRVAYYRHFDDLPSTGDTLAFDLNDQPTTPNPNVVAIRRAEISGIAPDLFDTTYYSIDPNFFQNYHQPSTASGRYANLSPILGKPVVNISDNGSRIGHPVYSAVTVETQISDTISGGLDPDLMNAELRYYLKDWRHLLTGWTLPKVQTFTFPDQTFGKCETSAPASVMVPGKCAMKGGRVGYSVRTLSRDYLLSNKWNVGGEQASPDTIRNPPDPGF